MEINTEDREVYMRRGWAVYTEVYNGNMYGSNSSIRV